MIEDTDLPPFSKRVAMVIGVAVGEAPRSDVRAGVGPLSGGAPQSLFWTVGHREGSKLLD